MVQIFITFAKNKFSKINQSLYNFKKQLMHKKLEAELISIAHQILQMKDKDDVVKLKNKAKDVYEKLSVLDFVNNYFLTTPNAKDDKKEILSKIETASSEIAEKKAIVAETPVFKEETTISKEQIQQENDGIAAEINKQTEEILRKEAKEIAAKLAEKEALKQQEEATKKAENSLAQNEEFKDSIPADVAANLFEKASKITKPAAQETGYIEQKEVVKEVIPPKPKPAVKPKPVQEKTRSSVNDRIFSNKIQIGLNDRIAFVKHLFNFSQEDFNRVLSQLNTFTTEKDAKDFIINVVQPDYDWTGKEEYIERLVMLIERRFA